MASFKRRRGSRRVTVYYWDSKERKQKVLKREDSAHLDELSDQEVQAWIESWERKNGRVVARCDKFILDSKDRTRLLWEEYQQNRKRLKNLKDQTVKNERIFFYNHIVPFFVQTYAKKDFKDWHALIPTFCQYMLETMEEYPEKLSNVKRILWTVKRFGEWLVYNRYMEYPWVVLIPARNAKAETPLKVPLMPDPVLDYAKAKIDAYRKAKAAVASETSPAEGADAKKKRKRNVKADSEEAGSVDRILALIALLGYFGGLRPSETYALTKEDFLTGDLAKSESKTYEGFRKLGLGTGLSVSITKAFVDTNPEDLPKTHYSVGVVNVWATDAALLIRDLVRDMPKGRLFHYSRPHLDKLWRDDGKKALGVTPHDMRRASGYFLGREIRIDLSLLQDHLRHSEIATTTLYTRRPVEERTRAANQDWDDIG